ncbi:MAG: FAD-dependent oxidoreductase [Candidatus Lokiarchaeota archaeon]|nr:FAD-dependent oxidoreductase [Candidatus Lokiarchaeota archaeon]
MSDKNDFELIIIGGGPAGLTAAIYGGRMGLRTALFESKAFGGLAGTAPKIENYPGIESINGLELTEKMRKQAENYGTTFFYNEVLAINPKEMTVTISKGNIKTKAIIIATGSKHLSLGLSNEYQLLGNGISYCATCDGPLFRDQMVAAVGGSNAAGLEVIYLSGIAKKVYLIHRRHCLRAEACIVDEVDSLPNVVPMYNCTIEEAITKDNKLGELKIKNNETGEISNISVNALFIAIGVEPQSELAKKAAIELDDDNNIKIDKNQETNFPGIYAAGDVTGGIRQVTTATGEATTAAMNAYLFIKKGWYGEGTS